MPPTITFGQSAAETVASEFEIKIDEDGYLVDEEGDYVIPSGSNEPMTIEEFAGTGVGSQEVIKNDFNSVSEYVEEHRSDN
jgi:flagellar basal body rod protein FlgG